MRLAHLGWLAFFTLATLGACSSEDNSSTDAETESVQSFCEDIVSATCETFAGCCGAGTKFDPFECRRVELAGCLDAVGIKAVNSGAFRFDASAAAVCMAKPTSCPGPRSTTSELSREQTIACNNVLTGPSPVGAGCVDDSDCASVGSDAYPSCFRPAGSPSGVCAKTKFSTDDSCGFFAKSLEHRLCPDTKQCRIPESALPPADAEGRARFDIHGTCQPRAKVGQSCGPTETGDYLECEHGLNCRYTGGAQPVCAQPKMKGQECSNTDECVVGLFCNPQTFLCDDAPGTDAPGSYCYASSSTPDGGIEGDGGTGGSGGSGGQDSGPECSTFGVSCSFTTDCCSGLACQSGTCLPPTQCLEDNQYCTSNAQCCSGTCNNNVCNGIVTCVPQYGACSSQKDCCSGYLCDSGMCL